MQNLNEPPTLLLGGSGFLGSYFAKILPEGSVIHLTSDDGYLDSDRKVKKLGRFHDEANLVEFLSGIEFNSVINCIALANIEECEKNPSHAAWLNVEIPRIVARYCHSIGASMVHISTDAVFDGKTPFRNETDLPSPISVYGRTKLQGENFVLKSLPQSIVARVNFFGHFRKNTSLFDFFYSKMKAEELAMAYHDVFFTPAYAAETVRLILELAESAQMGLFHVVGNQRISKYEFAKLISKVFETDLRYISRVEAPTSQMAQLRGYDLSLDNQKLRSTGIIPSRIEDGLKALKLEMEKLYAS